MRAARTHDEDTPSVFEDMSASLDAGAVACGAHRLAQSSYVVADNVWIWIKCVPRRDRHDQAPVYSTFLIVSHIWQGIDMSTD